MWQRKDSYKTRGYLGGFLLGRKEKLITRYNLQQLLHTCSLIPHRWAKRMNRISKVKYICKVFNLDLFFVSKRGKRETWTSNFSRQWPENVWKEHLYPCKSIVPNPHSGFYPPQSGLDHFLKGGLLQTLRANMSRLKRNTKLFSFCNFKRRGRRKYISLLLKVGRLFEK